MADCALSADLVGPMSRAMAVEGGLAYDTAADALKTCDGTNWATVGNSNANQMTSSNAAPATCDAAADGTLALTSVYTTCVCRNGTGWVSSYDGSTACVWAIPDPCANSPSIGTVCADGSVYAGLSPNGNVKMFATRCDYGMTWNGTSCTGSRGTLTWNNGTSTWYDIPSITNCTTSASCANTGKANSAAIAAVTSSGSGGPHYAAAYCEGLTANGRTDWYLPSLPELTVLYTNKSAGGLSGTFDVTGNWYWTSSEYNSSAAWVKHLSDGLEEGINGYKNTNAFNSTAVLRCVRR